MQKMKKSIDFLTKSSIVKLAGRSQKLANIIFENEKNLKKLFVKTKISWYIYFYRDRIGEAQENSIGFEQKGWKNLRRH